MVTAKFIKEVEVPDPQSNMYVDVSMFKHDNGGIFGVDSSYLIQTFEDNELVAIPDPFGDNNSDKEKLVILLGL